MPVDPLPDGTELFVAPAQAGRYRIESSLSAGGFGLTYRAIDRWFEQSALTPRVVIKELACDALVHRAPGSPAIVPNSASTRADHERFLQEFYREARLLLRLRNRHLVDVIDVWTENGTAYYAMLELNGASALGTTPTAANQAPAVRPWADVEFLAIQILDGLDAIHRGNVLHLDIKPENLLLCADGRVVLIDFGTARRKAQVGTAVTRLSGVSLFYAPRELVVPFFAPTQTPAGEMVALPQPHEIGPWSDLYSWAMVVYGMVLPHPTERPWMRSFGAPDPYSTATADLRRVGVPDAWAQVLQQCITIDPAQRRKIVGSAPHVRALLRPEPSATSWSLPQWAVELENGPEIVVCAQGTGTYRTIGAAVSAAPPGARIVVRPGTYAEALVLEKPLMLEGRRASGETARDEVIIASSNRPCIKTRKFLCLRGLTLKASDESDESHIVVIDAIGGRIGMSSCRVCGDGEVSGVLCGENSFVFDCDIDSVTTGIRIWGDEVSIVECRVTRVGVAVICMFNSEIRRSTLDARLIAISLNASCHVDIEDTTVSGSQLLSSPGTTRLTARRCRLRGEQSVEAPKHLLLEDCSVEVTDKRGAILVPARREAVLRGCIIRGASGPAVVVHGTAIVERCDLRNSKGGIRCEPGGRVDASDNIE